MARREIERRAKQEAIARQQERQKLGEDVLLLLKHGEGDRVQRSDGDRVRRGVAVPRGMVHTQLVSGPGGPSHHDGMTPSWASEVRAPLASPWLQVM